MGMFFLTLSSVSMQATFSYTTFDDGRIRVVERVEVRDRTTSFAAL